MTIKINTSYRIYGKIAPMKRMKPVGGSEFVTNLIYAEIFTPKSEEDIQKLQRELDFLNTQGEFELREVAGA